MLDGANRVISFAEFFFNRLITHLDVAELALDHPKRMLHLGTDTGLEFLGLLNESALDVCFYCLRLPGRRTTR